MAPQESTFHEANLGAMPIRDLGLTIEGTRLEPVVAEFERELAAAGIRKLRPRFYLSTEWGVPFGTVGHRHPVLPRPARPDRAPRRARGYVEGSAAPTSCATCATRWATSSTTPIGSTTRTEWVKLFGSITQPYVEEYRPEPFSRRYVRHLPGWYAQKHPDEDWAETFAVWMTPGLDWRDEYADWPAALAKLELLRPHDARARRRATRW